MPICSDFGKHSGDFIYTIVAPALDGYFDIRLSSWWARLDSNQRSREAAELQSAAIAAMRLAHMFRICQFIGDEHNKRQTLSNNLKLKSF